MITGASLAEAAILICSVAEGVQEQTKRHAYVLRMMGLEQVIVVYNKMDAVDFDRDRFEAVKDEMDAFLNRLGVEPSMDIPISAYEGDNVAARSAQMPWYEGMTVVEALDTFRKLPAPVEKPLRFPVQDVYDGRQGSLVVGRVESGVLNKGQLLRFLPAGMTRTVAHIVKYGEEELAQAAAGECVGIDLSDELPRRGQIGCPTDALPSPTTRFAASVFWLAPQPLALDEQEGLAVRCATQQQPCRIVELSRRLDSSTLEPIDARDALEETEVGEVVLETEAPLVVESFYDVQELGRFVLVRGRDVVAGGIVTASAD
jgi:sulfate adenylyltransferase subunit 1 (EFTu-like GTPase family)